MNQLFNKLKGFIKGNTISKHLPQETLNEAMISISNENKYLRQEKEDILLKNKQLEQNLNILIDAMIDIKNNSIETIMEEINVEVNNYINFTMVNYGVQSYKFIDLVRAEINSKDELLVDKFVENLEKIDKKELHTLFPNLKSLYLSKHQEKKFSSIDKKDIKNILIAFGNGIIPDTNKYCKILCEQANIKYIDLKKELNAT